VGDECDDLLRDIADFLHGDIDAERKAHLRDHLDDCPPCFETADFQAQLRSLIARRCGEEVPEGLQARVFAMLQVQVRTDSATPGDVP
jgi:anti-sigma factor (TIGR02949 family)